MKITTSTGKKCYKILLWKAYFDKGFSLTNNLKYALVLFGWVTQSKTQTIAIAIIWAISSLIIGRLWYGYKIIEIENEVGNHVNPFAREMREFARRGKQASPPPK